MTLSQVRFANFGKSKSGMTGSSGVGYTLFDPAGSIFAPRTTTGVYEVVTGSGIYAANVEFSTSFLNGMIVWDTPETGSATAFVADQFNIQENDHRVLESISVLTGTLNTVSSSIDFLVSIEGGRWKVDTSQNRMIFYKSDNATVVATFDLFDAAGAPTSTEPFERRRV